ncbi:putative retrotransposon protein, partial [Tanacetum coccineum]
DNTGAITIANESGITKGARHYRAKVYYLCEVIEFGDVKREKVHTDDNLTDPFTKALAFPKHSEHTKNIGMLPDSSLMWSLMLKKILRAVTYVEETSWCKFVPRKVNVFIWRLKCGQIPVRSILDHIGIDLDSTLCPCCENVVETIDHIMVRCPLVSAVWSKIFLWWGIGCFNGSSLSDILPSHGLVSSKLESVWQAVIRSSLYLIWKARNSKVFKSKEMVVADIFFEIQLISDFTQI